MLSRSMKYHSLPSLSDLKAYQNGKLTADERNWIDGLVESNPMVAAVLENVNETNVATVQRVSASISKNINKTYISHRGFWSKYAGWIGLSSIVIILGALYLFQNSTTISTEPKYYSETIGLGIEKTDNVSEVQLNIHKDENNNKNALPSTETNNEEEKDNNEETKLDLASMPVITNTKESNEKDHNRSIDSSSDEEKLDKKNEEPTNLNTEDNTYSPGDRSATEKTGDVTLSVNSVDLLTKMNPDDFNTKSRGKNNNDPLGRNNTKREANASYSMDDLPSYPGGDKALMNYFKGKLRPIVIPAKLDKFDRSVMIELEINTRGKLKGHKIHGNLHPTHQEQLEKAIENLPRFDKGNGEKVTYSLAISF